MIVILNELGGELSPAGWRMLRSCLKYQVSLQLSELRPEEPVEIAKEVTWVYYTLSGT